MQSREPDRVSQPGNTLGDHAVLIAPGQSQRQAVVSSGRWTKSSMQVSRTAPSSAASFRRRSVPTWGKPVLLDQLQHSEFDPGRRASVGGSTSGEPPAWSVSVYVLAVEVDAPVRGAIRRAIVFRVVLFPRSVRTHQSGPSPPVDAEDEAPADHRNWRTLVPWISPGGYRAGSRSFPADRRVRTVATGRYFLSYAYGREGGRYQGLEQQAERGMSVSLPLERLCW